MPLSGDRTTGAAAPVSLSPDKSYMSLRFWPSGRGDGAFPQIRFVALLENGTHVLFGGQMAGYATSETTLAKAVLPSLRAGMLCPADRGFFGFALWKQAVVTSSAAQMVTLSRIRSECVCASGQAPCWCGA